MHNTDFSVLMSVYYKERPEQLRESLDSVFSQTLLPTEVVLVEDGPLTPGLYNEIERFKSACPQLKVVRLHENGGLGKALNEGLKHCSYDLVARMDSDDICFPDRFRIQVAFMTSHPGIDICSSWMEEFEGDTANVISIKKLPETHAEIAEYIKTRNPLNHPAVIFRKSAVLKAGGYKHFPLFEDYYLWARMMVNGSPFANIPESLLHLRTSPEMRKRRGGIRYAITSYKFQNELHHLGLITRLQAIKSSVIRGIVYILPNNLRKLIYSKLLR